MRVLDLYSGAGGAARGYANTGYEVIGVDITKQHHYPYEFWHADALTVLRKLLDGYRVGLVGGYHYTLHEFDLIHASPPCQLYTAGNRSNPNNPHPDLVAPTRDLLRQTGLPWVIENVPGAPLEDHIELCGRMFGLGATDHDGQRLTLDRHRWFESSFPIEPPPTCRPHDRTLQVAGAYNGARRDKEEARLIRGGGYVPASVHTLRELLGIDWMNKRELYLAIPPAYTEWIGNRFRERNLQLDMERKENEPGDRERDLRTRTRA